MTSEKFETSPSAMTENESSDTLKKDAKPKRKPQIPYGKGCLMEQTTARKIAKTGLVVSLGVLAISGFVRSKSARQVHTAAGVAALGLSLWHYSLYPSKTKTGNTA
jgi:hypothetical protein